MKGTYNDVFQIVIPQFQFARLEVVLVEIESNGRERLKRGSAQFVEINEIYFR